jgi:hypothetical protein
LLSPPHDGRQASAQAVQDDVQRAVRAPVPLVVVQPREVADQSDDVAGVHVVADLADGPAGVEQQGDRVADGPKAVRREVPPDRRLNSGQHATLHAGVLRHAVESSGQRIDGLGGLKEFRREVDQVVDHPPVDLDQQRLPRREVPVERALPNARLLGYRVQPELRGAWGGDLPASHLNDPGAVLQRVLAGGPDHRVQLPRPSAPKFARSARASCPLPGAATGHPTRPRIGASGDRTRTGGRWRCDGSWV